MPVKYIVLCCLGLFLFSPVCSRAAEPYTVYNEATPAHGGDAALLDDCLQTAVANAEWKDQRDDASSFASDWLTDLDNMDFAAAASAYTITGEPIELEAKLQAARAGLGALRERNYGWARVLAIAHDESECRVEVVFTTRFEHGVREEWLDILLGHEAPVVMIYELKGKE